MIDLTPHLTSAEQHQLGRLFMSDSAAEHLRGLLLANAPTHAETSQFAPLVAKSVADFLTSDYFRRSRWFRQQKVHAVPVLAIGGDKLIVCHLVTRRDRRLVVAPSEVDLPADYFERRLLEELRVECGVPETNDVPKGRLQ